MKNVRRGSCAPGDRSWSNLTVWVEEQLVYKGSTQVVLHNQRLTLQTSTTDLRGRERPQKKEHMSTVSSSTDWKFTKSLVMSLWHLIKLTCLEMLFLINSIFLLFLSFCVAQTINYSIIRWRFVNHIDSNTGRVDEKAMWKVGNIHFIDN